MSYEFTVTLGALTCCNCGITFAMPETLIAERRRDHATFYCPSGHPQHFASESKEEKLRKQVEDEQRIAASLRENMIAAQRAKDRAEKSLKRLKKRTAAGVCPCCNRTVHQLAQHMESKHKEFLALNGLTAPKQLPESVQ